MSVWAGIADFFDRVVDTTNNVVKVSVSGNAANIIADGADVVEGATTDAAVVTSTTGTISGKLRGLISLAITGLAVIGNVAAGVADSGAPVKVGGKYNAAGATALSDGQRGDLQVNSASNLLTSMATLLSGEDQTYNVLKVVTAEWSTNNITTKTTTVVKAGPGILGGIVINKTGSVDTLTIYDNTAGSGTIVATITTPTVGQTFTYDRLMTTGITIVSAGTTAGDYTVKYL